MRRRRETEIFTLSFLDCICCGFGAVVLLYVVMSANIGVQRDRKHEDLGAEVSKLEEEVLIGYKNLVVLRNVLQKTDTQSTTASGSLARIMAEIERTRLDIASYSGDSMAQREHINKLKSDIKSLEEGNRRLSAGAAQRAAEGEKVRAFRPEGGDRKYLTGIKVNGQRVLILVDASASMLDETLVNILRMRNLPDVQQMLAPKWQRTVATVDWLLTQLPAQSQFQVLAFNTQPRAALTNTTGQWLSARDPRVLNNVVQALRRTVPRDGTSLINVFNATKSLNPLPDQIILITDGLPTQGATPPAIRKAVDVDQRVRLFEQSVDALPAKVPVTVILMPMEGDVPAPARYWRLARDTGGVFMMPSKDWP